MNKKLLLGLGGAALTILPIATMLSCSSTPSVNISEKAFKTVQTGPNRTSETKVLDPAFNEDAQKIINELVDTLTVEKLQEDFDFILTDFYDVYEFENKDIEIELVDRKPIEVLSISKDRNSDGFKTAKLNVTYEFEIDERNDNEGVKSKIIDWVIKPVVSSPAQIEEIKEMILGSSTNNDSIDLKDLKEYFLGEKDDDDFDDIGVFDRIARLNADKDLNNLGGLLGYELKLNDIFGPLMSSSTRNVTMETTFFAPSVALNDTFIYPDVPGTFDFTFNLDVLARIPQAEILTYTTKEQLQSILVANNEINTQEKFDTVASIEISAPGGQGTLLMLTINFKDINQLPEVISINPNLLLDSSNPVPQ